MAKKKEGHISAHFLMINVPIFKPKWRFGSACVRAATQMMNRMQKLLYGVQPYFVCITASTKVFEAKIPAHIPRCLVITFMLLCWFISTTRLDNACKCWDVFCASRYIPIQRKCVSTLPCEMWMEYKYIRVITNKHFGKWTKNTSYQHCSEWSVWYLVSNGSFTAMLVWRVFFIYLNVWSVSYTHLTLPTNREV